MAPVRLTEERPKPAVALQRAVKLLETSSATFFKGSGCVGCHHQPLVARAQFYARASGISINEEGAKEQALQMKSLGVGLTEDYLQGIIPGGGASRIAETLLGLRASNVAADGITDAAVVAIAESQEADGSWTGEMFNTGRHLLKVPLRPRCVAFALCRAIPFRRERKSSQRALPALAPGCCRQGLLLPRTWRRDC